MWAGLGIRSFPHRSVAHLLIALSLIRSSLCRSFAHFAQIKWATVRDSLRSLKTNEQLWANRSCHSEEMSDRERIPQVAPDKWVTVSDSLRSLRGNEQMSDSLKKCWPKKSKILFLVCFIYNFLNFFYWKNERIPHFLFFGERCEWIAQVAHQKWAMWANRSGCSPKMSEWVNPSFFWVNRSFAHFWAKNEQFARKTDEQIPSPRIL